MSERANKTLAPPKNNKTKRPSTVNIVPSTSKTRVSATVTHRVKPTATLKEKINKNFTVIEDLKSSSIPDNKTEYYQIEYGKYLRSLLEECLVDTKIEREETQLEIQITQLTDRFHKTIDMLDKTNRRIKDISFIVEQKRLIDLKNQDCTQFHKTTDNSNAQDVIGKLAAAEQTCLDKLETRNIDFGYNEESGHKKLLDAVNDAIEGLEQIRKHSKLDINKFEEYEKTPSHLDSLEQDRLDTESLKLEFEKRFPKLNEKLLEHASAKIAKIIADDEDFDV